MRKKSATDLGTRRDWLMHEHIHDSCKTPHKLPEPTVCPDCRAVFHEGRWQWITTAPNGAHQTSCQASHLASDNYPTGVITLSGGYVQQHRDELLQMARNREVEEKQTHPLHRIMSIEEHSDSSIPPADAQNRSIARALRREPASGPHDPGAASRSGSARRRIAVPATLNPARRT